jgi:hypothetical protein
MADYSSETDTDNEYRVDENGLQVKRLQLAKIIMGTPADKSGYIFSPWNGKDPRKIHGRFVFILSKLEDRHIYPYITLGDLSRLETLDTGNTLIPTACLVGEHIGDRTIGTYLYPPSSMLCPSGNINIQQAQTLLPNLMKAGRILMHVLKNPYENTFWYKFDKGESSNVNLKHHLTPLHKRLQIPGRFIDSTFPHKISPTGKKYQPLRDYIPHNPETLYRHSSVGLQNSRMSRMSGMSGITTGVRKKIYNLKKIPEVIRLNPIPEGGKSRRKLKTTNRRTNRRTTKRRNTRTNRRRNTKKRRN